MTIIPASLLGLYFGYDIGRFANSFFVPFLLTYKAYGKRFFNNAYQIIDSYETHKTLRVMSDDKSPVLPYHEHIEALGRYEDEAYRDHISYHKKMAIIYLKGYYKQIIVLSLTAILLHVLVIFLISFIIGFIASAIPQLRRKYARADA